MLLLACLSVAASGRADTPRALLSGEESRPKEGRRAWYLMGGTVVSGSDVGWNAGLFSHDVQRRWEGALDFGAFQHHDSILIPTLGTRAHSDLTVSELNFSCSRLFRIESVRNLHRERLFGWPGFLRTGAGIAIYTRRHAYFESTTTSVRSDVYSFTRHTTRAAPFVSFGIDRDLGSHFLLRLSGKYVYAPERIGVKDYTVGGIRGLAQLAYRFE